MTDFTVQNGISQCFQCHSNGDEVLTASKHGTPAVEMEVTITAGFDGPTGAGGPGFGGTGYT